MQSFWTRNEDGYMGGVELAFLSVSRSRDVALQYATVDSVGKPAILFEVRGLGMHTENVESGGNPIAESK